MKKIALIGSTGSIGRQTLDVVKNHPDKFKIVSLAAMSSGELYEKQVRSFRPAYAALESVAAFNAISRLPKDVDCRCGEENAIGAASFEDADIVVNAVGGFAGLKYSIAALEAGKTLALANKETLVCGGEIVTALAKSKNVSIIPVDSEHSAIWQCLSGRADAQFKRLIITSSGGALRGFTPEQLKNVTPEQALNHPTWKMGAKITVDCATLLNKAFEVMEARWLFDAAYRKISTVIHPQSIVHSLVEFKDGAIMAQMGTPNMEIPIQLALSYPERLSTNVKPLDFKTAFSLDFEPLKRKDYPCYDIALKCAEAGGTMPCVLNAASEVAVNAFLKGKISFTAIYEIIDAVLQRTPKQEAESYLKLKDVDSKARWTAQKLVMR